MAETPQLARVRDAFSAQAARFDAYAPQADPETAERFARALGPCATGRILDVACGTGAVTAAVAATAAEVTGLDATEAMLARARARAGGLPNVTFRTGEAEALPFADASFDAVVTRLSLHHMATPAKAAVRNGPRAPPRRPRRHRRRRRCRTIRRQRRCRTPSRRCATRRTPGMLPAAELDGLATRRGLRIVATESWEKTRQAEEWLGITAELAAPAPLATVLRALAAAGVGAGMDLALRAGRVTFVHRWRLVAADKPQPGPAA